MKAVPQDPHPLASQSRPAHVQLQQEMGGQEKREMGRVSLFLPGLTASRHQL